MRCLWLSTGGNDVRSCYTVFIFTHLFLLYASSRSKMSESPGGKICITSCKSRAGERLLVEVKKKKKEKKPLNNISYRGSDCKLG